MRKGEPKTSLGLTHRAFNRRTPGCGAATRYSYARRRIAGRLPAPVFPELIRAIQGASPIKEARKRRLLLEPSLQTVFTVLREISGWETDGYTLSGLGEKSVPGKLAGMKGKPLLTAKSLSATSVYHIFGFLFSHDGGPGQSHESKPGTFHAYIAMVCSRTVLGPGGTGRK